MNPSRFGKLAVAGLVMTFFISHAAGEVFSDPDPSDGETEVSNSPTLSVEVSDPQGDSMDVEFYNSTGSTDQLIGVEEDVSSGSRASVDWSGREAGENYTWHAIADNGSLSTQSDTWNFTVSNRPRIVEEEPADNGLGTGDPVELSVEVADPEGSDMNVYFFNNSDGTAIGQGKVSGVSDGGTATVDWSGLKIGENYEWNAIVSDGLINNSYVFEFKKMPSDNIRITSDIDYRYTAVVTDLSSSRVIFLKVKNRANEPKDLNTSFEGVNASFVDGSKWKDYTLQPSSSKRFEIQLNPSTTGDTNLTVKTRNQDLGIDTRSSIPVLVRKDVSTGTTREAPGIGIIHMILLSAVSTLLYFSSL